MNNTQTGLTELTVSWKRRANPKWHETRNVKNERNFWVQVADWTRTFALPETPRQLSKGIFTKGKSHRGWGAERGARATAHRRPESRGTRGGILGDRGNRIPWQRQQRWPGGTPLFTIDPWKAQEPGALHSSEVGKWEGVPNKKEGLRVCSGSS